MRPLFLAKQELGDQKFKVTLLDKHQSLHKSEEESTAFDLTINKGKLEKMDIAYNGEKKISLGFYQGPMGRMMVYDLLDPKLELNDQLRLGLTQYLDPGLQYLDRIVNDYQYPRIFHRYADGTMLDMFYNPDDKEHPLVFCSGKERNYHYAFFNFDKENGVMESRPKRGDLLEVKEMNNDQKTSEKKHDTLEMRKMAIFAELNKLTPLQQQDVLATVQKKLDLYRSNYGKE